MTTVRRDWVRIIGLTGAALMVAGAVTLGGLTIGRATGLIDASLFPKMRGNGMMHGRGHMDGGAGMMGGRGDGMMGGRGHKEGGFGMMGQAQSVSEADVLVKALSALQAEQSLAQALVADYPELAPVVSARTADIATLSDWLGSWYPDAVVPTAEAATGSIEDLQWLMLHNSQHLLKAASTTSGEHAELTQWLADVAVNRAAEFAAVYGQNS
jgi:hypothetical protein